MRFLLLLPALLALSGSAPAPRGLAITGVTLNPVSWVDARGNAWDALGTGPDFYVAIEVGGQVRYRSGVHRDAYAGLMPLSWNIQPAFAFAEGQQVRILVLEDDPGSYEVAAVSSYLSTRALTNYLSAPQRVAASNGASLSVSVSATY